MHTHTRNNLHSITHGDRMYIMGAERVVDVLFLKLQAEGRITHDQRLAFESVGKAYLEHIKAEMKSEACA